MGVCYGMTSLGTEKVTWRLRAYKKFAREGFIDKPWEMNVQVCNVITKRSTLVVFLSFWNLSWRLCGPG